MCSDDIFLLLNAWFSRKYRKNQLSLSFSNSVKYTWSYMFLYLNKQSVFNCIIYTPTLTKSCFVTSISTLPNKYSGYFSDFLSLLPYYIFKKWLRIFSAFQVCDCAGTLKNYILTSVHVIPINLILFFKISMHNYWKKSLFP